ncbi:MAG: sulfatase [Qingshengfaniella sp.]
MTKRPNFLFIMTDQQRADWLGCAGHPVVKTPHIDALAARGTRFENFFAASPVCMPNRASFMTGRYPSVNGARYNGCSLPLRANTFVDVLAAAGYRTASIGKSHLQPLTDVPPKIPAPETGPIAEAWKADGGDYTLEEPSRYQPTTPYDFPVPYYGFQHVDMVTGHGDRAGGHYQQWFRATHPDWQALTDPANELPHNYSCPQAYRTPIPEDSYPTAYVRDRAIDYLRANAGGEAPLFTYVSFPDPHHPFNPPGRYWDMYDPEDFDIPRPYAAHRNPPPPLRALRAAYEARAPHGAPTSGVMISDRQVQEAMALTAGMITMIDDAVGALIDCLRETGQLENTVIVYNADHGDYLGDYNLLLKGPWAAEAINRVPMIWSDPGAAQGMVSQALGSTVDLSATILERAGVKPYNGMQGRSLLPCLDGAGTVRDSLLIEYNGAMAQMGFDGPSRVRSVMTADWQLSLYGGEDWGELYDRHATPLQGQNLWDDPAHAERRLALTQDLAQHLIAQMDRSPGTTRLA